MEKPATLQVKIKITTHLSYMKRLCPGLRQQTLEALQALSSTPASIEEIIEDEEPSMDENVLDDPNYWTVDLLWTDYQGPVSGINDRLRDLLDPVVKAHFGVGVDLHWQLGDLSGRDHLALSRNGRERAYIGAFLCGEHLKLLMDHFGMEHKRALLVSLLARELMEDMAREPATAAAGQLLDRDREPLEKKMVRYVQAGRLPREWQDFAPAQMLMFMVKFYSDPSLWTTDLRFMPDGLPKESTDQQPNPEDGTVLH